MESDRWRIHSLCLLVLALVGCAVEDSPIFEHELSSAATPWTHERFDNKTGKFTFAIFSDLSGGEREGVFSIAAEQLSVLRPELVLSLGDLIDGATDEVAGLAREWDDFDARAALVRAPVFRLGGNHDLTGQTLRNVWSKRYGPRYYHFLYKDVLFLMLDTEDHTPDRMRAIYDARSAALQALEAGDEGAREMEYFRMPERVTGNIGAEQAAYFQSVLADHPKVRWTMLLMHKPVWQGDGDPEFVALEAALGDRPYTVFNGHLHSMSYTVKNDRDYIMVGTTGGGQAAADPMSFDHITLVTVAAGGPSIAHLRLDGILGKDGQLPADGAALCFQASACSPGP